MCHDWLVGRQPAPLAFGESGDVTGSIEVGMKGIPTKSTSELELVAVLPIDISTEVTTLARIMTVDEDNILPLQFSFIPNKGEQLRRTPASQQFHTLLSTPPFAPHLHCCDVQFFQSKSIEGQINNASTDAVVCISNEPSFSSYQISKMPVGRPSACTLETRLQISILSFNLSQFSTGEELTVTCDNGVVNSPVYSEDSFVFGLCLNSWYINNNIQEDSLFSDSYCRSSCLSENVPFENVLRDFYRILFSSLNCTERDLFGMEENFERIVIESNSTIISFRGLSFVFEAFKHIARLVTDGSYNATIQSGIFCPNITISQGVEFAFIENLFLKTNFDTILTRLISYPNSLSKNIITEDFGTDSNLHMPSNINIDINLSIP